jgi:hypothetical protein
MRRLLRVVLMLGVFVLAGVIGCGDKPPAQSDPKQGQGDGKDESPKKDAPKRGKRYPNK